MNAKEKILIAAAKLFSKKDFASTSIREIASLAGVNLAMINYYFKSKDKLLENILKNGVSIVIKETEQLLLLNISELEKIDLIINLYSEHIFRNKEITLIFFQQQMSNSNSEISRLFNELSDWNRKVFGELIFKVQQKKLISGSANASLLLATLVGTIQQVVVDNFYRTDKPLNEQLIPTQFNKEQIVSYLKKLTRKILLD
jgi:AcrR family transcriptional regulator